MKRIIQIFLPILVIAAAAALVSYFVLNKPEPSQRKWQTPTPEVAYQVVESTDFRVMLSSQGTARARTESVLIPEVRGKITAIGDSFQEGAFFEKGEILLEIDPRDYETELTVADANLAQAELVLFEEKARYDQARLDWDRLNPGEEPSLLVLREPQLRQAQANRDAALARLENARLNHERTRIEAPYAGRVLSKSVDVGQYVAPGSQLAEIYAVDYAEVRLPLTASQFARLDLPAIYRGEDPILKDGPVVELTANSAGRSARWMGRIVRAEGAIDTSSRLISVVCEVSNPYARREDGSPPLKVGAFVEARIEGMVLENVYVIPRRLLRENAYVLLVDKDDYLLRKSVNVVWQDKDRIVIDSGLLEGDRLCLTHVPYALEGWQVVAREANFDPLVAEREEVEEIKRERRPPTNTEGRPRKAGKPQ